MDRLYYVYIPASRAWEHREGKIPGFTRQYRIFRLVYYESFPDARVAIGHEKQVKAWTRAKRVALIESMNPTWEDLAEGWFSQQQNKSRSLAPLGMTRKVTHRA